MMLGAVLMLVVLLTLLGRCEILGQLHQRPAEFMDVGLWPEDATHHDAPGVTTTRCHHGKGLVRRLEKVAIGPAGALRQTRTSGSYLLPVLEQLVDGEIFAGPEVIVQGPLVTRANLSKIRVIFQPVAA